MFTVIVCLENGKHVVTHFDEDEQDVANFVYNAMVHGIKHGIEHPILGKPLAVKMTKELVVNQYPEKQKPTH